VHDVDPASVQVKQLVSSQAVQALLSKKYLLEHVLQAQKVSQALHPSSPVKQEVAVAAVAWT